MASRINYKLGRMIAQIRKQRNLTQEDLAEKVDLHYTTISRIETGESDPPVSTIEKIARALKVPLSELFSF